MRLDRQFLARGQDDDKLSGAAQDDGAMADKNGGTSERIVVLVSWTVNSRLLACLTLAPLPYQQYARRSQPQPETCQIRFYR